MPNGFPPEVAEQLKYYVYRLIDPRNGETFYVGKGQGDRVFNHVNNELALPDASPENWEEDAASVKLTTIRAIHMAELDVLHIIHRHGMTEKEALQVEAALIDVYPGLTNQMRGHDADRGPANAMQLIADYQAEEMSTVSGHRILILKTSRRVVEERGSLYEAVRRQWRLNPDRARRADYVLGCINSVCVGVFMADRWVRYGEDRWAFEGHEVRDLDITELYLDKLAPEKFRRQQNPVGYINC